MRYWPAAMIVVGVSYLLRTDSRSERIFGGCLTVIGAVLLSETLFHYELDIWRFWPLVIVVFGILMVTKAFQSTGHAEQSASGRGVRCIEPGQRRPGPRSRRARARARRTRRYNEVAIWSGIERRVASPAFKRADLTAVMGGIEFDLRQAGTDRGEAVIEVFAVWGGIEIIVPPDWAVSNKVTAIMGWCRGPEFGHADVAAAG
jgi:predicted membrane protein